MKYFIALAVCLILATASVSAQSGFVLYSNMSVSQVSVSATDTSSTGSGAYRFSMFANAGETRYMAWKKQYSLRRTPGDHILSVDLMAPVWVSGRVRVAVTFVRNDTMLYSSALDTLRADGTYRTHIFRFPDVDTTYNQIIFWFSYFVGEDGARAIFFDNLRYQDPLGYLVVLDDPSGPMAVGDGEAKFPGTFALAQNYPNPFNPSTTISYELADRSYVTLTVVNSLGQVVATLDQGEQGPGEHFVRFNADNLPSGIYLYRCTAGSRSAMGKMILLR